MTSVAPDTEGARGGDVDTTTDEDGETASAASSLCAPGDTCDGAGDGGTDDATTLSSSASRSSRVMGEVAEGALTFPPGTLILEVCVAEISRPVPPPPPPPPLSWPSSRLALPRPFRKPTLEDFCVTGRKPMGQTGDEKE